NLGPLVPTPDACLNCGTEYTVETCPECGLSRAQARAFLRVPEQPPDDAVARAEAAFGVGLFRHGEALLNQLLAQRFDATEAWELKGRMLDALGNASAHEAMLAEALNRGAPAVLLIRYGSLLARRGAHTEAVAVFARFLDTEPVDPHTLAV